MSGPGGHFRLLFLHLSQRLGLGQFSPDPFRLGVRLSLALADAGLDERMLRVAERGCLVCGPSLCFCQSQPAQQETGILAGRLPLVQPGRQPVLPQVKGPALLQPALQTVPMLDQGFMGQGGLFLIPNAAICDHQPGPGQILHQPPATLPQLLAVGPTPGIAHVLPQLYQAGQGLPG